MATDYIKLLDETINAIFNIDNPKKSKMNDNDLEILNKLILLDKSDEIIKNYSQTKSASNNNDDYLNPSITSTHSGKRELEEAIYNLNMNNIASNEIELNRHWFFEDMAENLVVDLRNFQFDNEKNKILIIEDALDVKLETKYRKLLGIIRFKKYCELSNDEEKLKELKADCITKLEQIEKFLKYIKDSENTSKEFLFTTLSNKERCNETEKRELLLGNYRYIFLDLLIGQELLGLEIIKRLKEIQEYHPDDYKYEIIMVSRSTNTDDIQKALNFGASLYIQKDRIFSIPYRIAQLGKEKPMPLDENKTFRNLNKLPKWKKKGLQTTFLKYDSAEHKDWIKKLPKADIHCHLGGYLDAEITLKLSQNIVYHTLDNFDEYKDFNFNPTKEFDTIKESVKNHQNDDKGNLKFTKRSFTGHLKDYKIKPIEVLGDMLLEICSHAKKYKEYSKNLHSYSKKCKKNKKYLFHLKNVKSPEEFFSYLANKYKNSFFGLKSFHVTAFFNCFLSIEDEVSKSKISEKEIIDKLLSGEFTNTNLEKLIQATHGNKLEKNRGGISLQSFLKGCDYTGSDIMQTKYTIKKAICHICKKAEEDKVYYLSLRITPLNFTEAGLSEKEVWDSIREGYKEYKNQSNNKDYFLILTIIVALKRHYKKDKLKANIKFGIKHRLDNLDYPKYFEQDQITKEFKEKIPFISGFDLTGLESGNNPVEFRNNFQEIFESCMPITIHAGEETEAKYIWEAAYELNADRIGHGLSLANDNEGNLRNRFKDFNICVELCPSSNFLTQGNYNYNKNKYPSSIFLEDNMNFVVCTDDPAIQNTDLSTEYLWLSKLTSRKGISKWEALSLIRNSFRYCFLPYDIKGKLLNIIDHKVYKLLSDK